ncbi:trypsin-like peptidase domain-containing protein [Streptomyces sp. RFCAC02]|uniref:S1C family serine protease n=1 Tax=Streptomyces sp. RFCAC02 TaxID=2499143 RepID=UPI001020B767|nr:trypsin-like peptidase domain-containing protein [Streptomyces sp. RFCAC02]
MDEGQSASGHRAAPRRDPGSAPPDSPPGAAGGAAPEEERPGHDPYGTPPYGQPGPWAPAPPVQLPQPTPPAGTRVGAAVTPPAGTHVGAPPQGPPPAGPAVSAPPAPSRYDPWAPRDLTPAAGTPVPPEAADPAPRAGARRLVLGALVLALVAGIVGGTVGVYLERHGAFSEVTLSQTGGDDDPPEPGTIAGIARAVLPSVVTLHVSGGTTGATGTGFVLDDRGHILTNAHVVRPAGEGGVIEVTFAGGESARAEIVGQDAGYDLAVVKVTGVSGLTPVELGDSDTVRVGDPVVAIGAPFDLAGTVTSGIISATERPITAGGEEADGSDISYVNALQTDAPINPGNSGGPLVDADGRVIGVNSAIRTGDSGLGTEQSGSVGLGFAIPVNQAKDVAEQLINTGRATHPVIGVFLDTGWLGDGARVGTSDGGPAVEPGGPADEAGLEDGDVITAVDGETVRSGDELIVKVRSHRPGDELVLTVERDGEELSLTVTLGEATGEQ